MRGLCQAEPDLRKLRNVRQEGAQAAGCRLGIGGGTNGGTDRRARSAGGDDLCEVVRADAADGEPGEADFGADRADEVEAGEGVELLGL